MKKHYGFYMQNNEEVGENKNQNQEAPAAPEEVKKPKFSPKELISKGKEKAKSIGKKAWDNRGKIAFGLGAVATVAGALILDKRKSGRSEDLTEEDEDFDESEELDELEEEDEDFTAEEADEEE